jgi:hypothetical protein
MPNRSGTNRAVKEAKAWWDRLGQKSITTSELYAFRDWRQDPENDAAYTKFERRTPRRHGRYAVLPSPGGFAVIDTFTGEPAEFANARLADIDVEDANDLAEILSRRHFQKTRLN